MALSENAKTILNKRYVRKDKEGNPLEEPVDVFKRVAKFIASIEEDSVKEEWEAKYLAMMEHLEFIPNSPTLVNAGTPKGSLSACFVMSPNDTMESIMDIAYKAALVEKWGGGIGFGLSKIRPRNDNIATTHGQALGPLGVMSIYSHIARVITQGSFRSGAHMAQLHVTHPDIVEFTSCKDSVNQTDVFSNFNISVQITDRFLQAVINGEDWDLINPKDLTIVGRVKALDLWTHICVSAWRTGDPGLAFIDRVRQTHVNPHLGLIESFNPCVTGDTLVYTNDGLVRIDSLINKNPQLVVDSRNGSDVGVATNVWDSGVKPVYKLTTKEGYTIKLTEDHKVFTERGKVPAGELVEGDKIRLLNHKGGFGNEGNRDLGLVMGWLAGDGHFTGGKAVLNLYHDDLVFDEIFTKSVNTLVKGVGERTYREYPVGTVMIADKDKGTISSTRLQMLLAEYNMTPDTKHEVPDVVYQGTEEMQSAYLSALFSADGTVYNTSKGSRRGVRLASSYLELLEGVQRVLLNFGIFSKIYKRRDAGTKMMPDGRGGEKEYSYRTQYDLDISKGSILSFRNDIGFIEGSVKNTKLNDCIDSYTRGFYKTDYTAQFDTLEYVGEERVYDLTEPFTNSFIANGLTISNCGEQALENFGSCNLGSINLMNHLTSDNKIDWDALRVTIDTAVRFLDNVIDLNTFPVNEIEDMNRKTRRIGLGVMGLADIFMMMGIPYASKEAYDLSESISKFLTENAWRASAELAKERGPFPEYLNSTLPRQGVGAVRHSCVTSIAPTGTISRIAGCNSGIEPYFSLAWKSNILWEGQKDSETTEVVDMPLPVRDKLIELIGEEKADMLLEEIAENPSKKAEVLAEFEVQDKLFGTAMDITTKDQTHPTCLLYTSPSPRDS